MHFVADVEGNKQRGHGFDDAGVLQLAAVDGAYAGDLHGEFRRDLSGVVVVAAHDDVAVHVVIAVEQVAERL